MGVFDNHDALTSVEFEHAAGGPCNHTLSVAFGAELRAYLRPTSTCMCLGTNHNTTTMVLLSMTAGIVRAAARAEELLPDEFSKLQRDAEPVLAQPKTGNPILHTQLIDLSKLIKKHSTLFSAHAPQPPPPTSDTETSTSQEDVSMPTTLNALLTSTTLYTPPPPPKPTQSLEYRRLMAKLRADQEALSYSRMLRPAPVRETFSSRFPTAALPYSLGATVPSASDFEDDVTYEEVHRQIILIINILVSVVAVAVFIWVAARHWTVGKRLGLSMGGSGAIAVCEVVVYGGYVRKVKEAKALEKKKPEIKEIVRSWIIDKGESVESTGKEKADGVDGVRFRKGKHR